MAPSITAGSLTLTPLASTPTGTRRDRQRAIRFLVYRGRVAWDVLMHPDAATELAVIPPREQVAVRNAALKLEALGPTLGFPHSSAVAAADRLRELRPRAGNCPWRAFYRQIGDVFVV